MRKYVTVLILIAVAILIGTVYTVFGTGTYTNVQSQIKMPNNKRLKVDFLQPPNTPLVFHQNPTNGEYYTVVKLRANKLLNSLPVSIPGIGFYNITILNVTKAGDGWYVYTVKISSPADVIKKTAGKTVIVGTGSNYTYFEVRLIKNTYTVENNAVLKKLQSLVPDEPNVRLLLSFAPDNPVTVGDLVFYDYPVYPINSNPVNFGIVGRYDYVSKPVVKVTHSDFFSSVKELTQFYIPPVILKENEELLNRLGVYKSFKIGIPKKIDNYTTYLKSGVFELFPVAIYFGKNYTIVTAGREVYYAYNMQNVSNATEVRSKAFLEAINLAKRLGYKTVLVYDNVYNIIPQGYTSKLYVKGYIPQAYVEENILLKYDNFSLNNIDLIIIGTNFKIQGVPIVIDARKVSITSSLIMGKIVIPGADSVTVSNSAINTLSLGGYTRYVATARIESSVVGELDAFTNSININGSSLGLTRIETTDTMIDNSAVQQLYVSSTNITVSNSYLIDLSIRRYSRLTITGTGVETLFITSGGNVSVVSSKVYNAVASVNSFYPSIKSDIAPYIYISGSARLNINVFSSLFVLSTVYGNGGVSINAVNSTIAVPSSFDGALTGENTKVYSSDDYTLIKTLSGSVTSGGGKTVHVDAGVNETVHITAEPGSTYVVTLNNGSNVFISGGKNITVRLIVKGYKGAQLHIEHSDNVSLILPANWTVSSSDIDKAYEIYDPPAYDYALKLSTLVAIDSSNVTVSYYVPKVNKYPVEVYTFNITRSNVKFKTVSVYIGYNQLNFQFIYSTNSTLSFVPGANIGNDDSTNYYRGYWGLSFDTLYAVNSTVYDFGYDLIYAEVVNSTLIVSQLSPATDQDNYGLTITGMRSSKLIAIQRNGTNYDTLKKHRFILFKYNDNRGYPLEDTSTDGKIINSEVYGVVLDFAGKVSSTPIVLYGSMVGGTIANDKNFATIENSSFYFDTLILRSGKRMSLKNTKFVDTTFLPFGLVASGFIGNGVVGVFYNKGHAYHTFNLNNSSIKFFSVKQFVSYNNVRNTVSFNVNKTQLGIYGIPEKMNLSADRSTVRILTGNVTLDNGTLLEIGRLENSEVLLTVQKIVNGTPVNLTNATIVGSTLKVLVGNDTIPSPGVFALFNGTVVRDSILNFEVKTADVGWPGVLPYNYSADNGIVNFVNSLINGSNITFRFDNLSKVSVITSIFYLVGTTIYGSGINAHVSVHYKPPRFGVYEDGGSGGTLANKFNISNSHFYITYNLIGISPFVVLASINNYPTVETSFYAKFITPNATTPTAISYGGYPPGTKTTVKDIHVGILLASPSKYTVIMPVGKNVTAVIDTGNASVSFIPAGEEPEHGNVSVPDAPVVPGVEIVEPAVKNLTLKLDNTVVTSVSSSGKLYLLSYSIIREAIFGNKLNITEMKKLSSGIATKDTKMIETIIEKMRSSQSNPAPFSTPFSTPYSTPTKPQNTQYITPIFEPGAVTTVEYLLDKDYLVEYRVSENTTTKTMDELFISPFARAIKTVSGFYVLPTSEYYGIYTPERNKMVFEVLSSYKKSIANNTVIIPDC